MSIYLIIVLCFVFLALVFGMKGKNSLSPFFKILLLNAFIYFFLAWFIHFLRIYNVSHGIVNNNHVYVNILTISEFSLSIYAAYTVLKNKSSFIIFLSGFVFIIAYIFHIYTIGFGVSFVVGDTITSITLSIVYLLLLNHFIKVEKRDWWKSPEILTSFGILLYFAGSVPLLSMSNYLIENYLDWYFVLFKIINFGFATLRYLLLTVSFYLIYKEDRNVKISA